MCSWCFFSFTWNAQILCCKPNSQFIFRYYKYFRYFFCMNLMCTGHFLFFFSVFSFVCSPFPRTFCVFNVLDFDLTCLLLLSPCYSPLKIKFVHGIHFDFISTHIKNTLNLDCFFLFCNLIKIQLRQKATQMMQNK